MREIRFFLFIDEEADAKKKLGELLTITQPVIKRTKIQTQVRLIRKSLKFAFRSHGVLLSVHWDLVFLSIDNELATALSVYKDDLL